MTRHSLLHAVVLVLLAGGLFSTQAFGQRAVEVYGVQHRRAEDLVAIAQAAMGDQGSTTLDARTNSLLLVGDPAAVAQALALLRAQDRRPRTVVLRHRAQRASQLEASGVRVVWNTGGGGVRVGNVRRRDAPAGIAITGGNSAARQDAELDSSVRILEGSTGHIATGQTVPVETRGRWQRTTTLVTAQSGFEATPRILGDGRIRVSLLPIQSQVGPDGEVAFTRAETTVILAPGETVAVGGLIGSGTSYQSGSGVRTSSGNDTTVLLLSAEIEE